MVSHMTRNGSHRDRWQSRWDALKLLLSFVLVPIIVPPLIVYERLVWAKNRVLCLLYGHDDQHREATIISDAYTSCQRCRKLLDVEDGTALDRRQA